MKPLPYLEQFLLLLSLALFLLLAGLMSRYASQFGRNRPAMYLGILLSIPTVIGFYCESHILTVVLLLFTCGYILLHSPLLESVRQSLLTLSRVWVEPTPRFSMVYLISGAVILVAACVHLNIQDEKAVERDLIAMEEMGSMPVSLETIGYGMTDAGTKIPLSRSQYEMKQDALEKMDIQITRHGEFQEQLIRTQPPDEVTNCHGWVFTGGNRWIVGSDVPTILKDNHYEEVSQPRPGDLVIYYEEERVAHTGIVRYVTPGLPVLVEGKWGRLGVFLHAVDQCCYGNEHKFFRSPRTGHRLRDTQLKTALTERQSRTDAKTP